MEFWPKGESQVESRKFFSMAPHTYRQHDLLVARETLLVCATVLLNL